ncbi:hypothetical protein [Swingsia samuiensis]|uniref:Uncharacterized protein n=1 Tax=Swingsia samuiensis TaxID=1293412 RepID=A0A4Y6UKH5_9PROT|nr:hypothetical protein [Swingsia samuiensis]QDH17300.1 hypothetical protein E3D00_06795 [Swingsia samuiensis]
MSISLDPSLFPAIDIITLAQTGLILRAERQTPPDGIPVFVTKEGWTELVSSHAPEHPSPHEIIIPALEKAITRLLSHAAETAEKTKEMAPVLYLESDLFPSNAELLIAFVRDKEHPVTCALIGTRQHLSHVLKVTASDKMP